MVFGIAMVRDEADIIETTLRHLARHVDRLIVADNLSEDGTRAILDRLATTLPLLVVDDREAGYFQSEKMTRLAEMAREQGAEWVVPFDADEIWLPRQGRSIRNLLTSLPPQVLSAEAVLFDHVATGIDDRDERDPVARLRWRRPSPAPLRKVAVRAVEGCVIEQGNHGATFPAVTHPPTVTRALEIRHFPYRSIAQFVSKARNGAAAYAATDLSQDAGGHWRAYGRVLAERGEPGLAEIFHQWFYRADPLVPLAVPGEQQPALVLDPAL